jgi:hypothetical protein
MVVFAGCYFQMPAVVPPRPIASSTVDLNRVQGPGGS